MLTTLLSVSVYAHNDQGNNVNNQGKQVIQYCNQAEAKPCKKKVVYMTYKQQERIKALEAEVARLKGELELAESQTRSVVRVVETIVEEKELNSVGLIVPYFATGLDIKDNAGSLKVSTENEFDVGLMYQRANFLDSDLRGTAAITARGGFLLGLGLDF